jgi:hypothetical protein
LLAETVDDRDAIADSAVETPESVDEVADVTEAYADDMGELATKVIEAISQADDLRERLGTSRLRHGTQSARSSPHATRCHAVESTNRPRSSCVAVWIASGRSRARLPTPLGRPVDHRRRTRTPLLDVSGRQNTLLDHPHRHTPAARTFELQADLRQDGMPVAAGDTLVAGEARALDEPLTSFQNESPPVHGGDEADSRRNVESLTVGFVRPMVTVSQRNPPTVPSPSTLWTCFSASCPGEPASR